MVTDAPEDKKSDGGMGTADAFGQQFEAFWKIVTRVRPYRSGFERNLAHLGKKVK